jgi:hypothetical protein
MNSKYEFYTINVYTKGFLKGYADGHITFNYNNNTYNHEFLYRFDDAENGNNYQLVSIDYGYKIPYINEVWQEIENYLKEYVNNKLVVFS